MKQYYIDGQLAYLNDHDAANRGNKYGGAKLKSEMTELVRLQLLSAPRVENPYIPTFTWRYSSGHDFDNIAFAKKFVLDGMVKAGVLPNDNQKWMLGLGGDNFLKVPKGQEGVMVEIEEFKHE